MAFCQFLQTIVGTIKLTTERKTHIIKNHPIMEVYLTNLKEVLEKPDDIRYSHYNLNVLLFYRYFDTIKREIFYILVREPSLRMTHQRRWEMMW